ncbi:WD-repeat protein [Cryptococcus neoformans]|nr:WD-repeat protein [Cryptococcus neoformans var. grubii Th84]OXG74274.1 WD-repeat protein [Cryptococcus neoformans var. grubii MW-RSA36]OXH03136.1 WD-repeat protein [Cryptococcus neoformans var. grubii]OXL05806.1 WD-repeat protein [Cryptococcus neoformans var. grubii Gb118]OXH25069.1 WD-repeat protein [Cryptococcus neoformans var. grubii]
MALLPFSATVQKGTVRPRSPSADEESAPLKQRVRQSAASSSLSTPASVLDSTANRKHMFSNMGQPMHDDGPSTSTHVEGNVSNGHSAVQPGSLPPSILSSIIPVRPSGTLMYEDDHDWASVQEKLKEQGDVEGQMEVDGDIDGKGKGTSQVIGRPGAGGGKRMPVEREEVVRLVLQGLRDIGYHQSADVLEAESGYQLCDGAATDFQNAILGGRWSDALDLLPELGIPVSNPAAEAGPSSESSSVTSDKAGNGVMSGTSPGDQARFLISQQKYLEYLEVGQQKKALSVLRGELARVAKDQNVLHTLSGFMMCLDKEDLYERAGWDGSRGISRRQLLEHLQEFISPRLMVPSRRLATLFDQARQQQQSTALYLDHPEANSLYSDYRNKPDQFPSVTTHVLVDHTDEVWRIEWSPDGTKLASAGKDRIVVIWNVEPTTREDGSVRYNVTPSHHFSDHNDPIDSMAWSPDGKLLVTGADKNVHIWDTEKGIHIPKQTPGWQHTDTISSIQWTSDGSEFLVTSMDCRIVFYNRAGKLLRQWSTFPLQFNDCCLVPDGSILIAITTPLKRVAHNDRLKQAMSGRPVESNSSGSGSGAAGSGSAAAATAGGGLTLLGGPDFGFATMEHSIVMVRMSDHEIIDWSQDLRCEMTSIRLSSDGKRALVSCSPDEIQEWSIYPGLKYLRRHTGHIQGNFLIRSCFGAVKDQFVLSGSEDGHVYVWQGKATHPIEVLSGHSDVVNAVAWNPVGSRKIFASCSDDKTVRIWQPPTSAVDVPTEPGLSEKIEVENSFTDSAGDGMVL